MRIILKKKLLLCYDFEQHDNSRLILIVFYLSSSQLCLL